MIERYSPKKKWYKFVALVLALAMSLNLLSGCGQANKNVSENTVAENTTTESIEGTGKENTEAVINENQLKTEDVLESLNDAITSEDTETASDVASNLMTLLDETEEELNLWLTSQDDIAETLSDETAEIYSERKTAFEEQLEKNEQEAEEILERINDALSDEDLEAATSNVAELEALLMGEKDTYTYGDTLLNEVIAGEADEEEIDEASNQDAENKSDDTAETVSETDENNKINDEYLETTGDVALSDEITALASELKTPLAVYNYLKNNIGYETYYGSRKGASDTLSALAGNDMDQASLLISMLRLLGYQAYYVRGNITITPEQAISLTGADTAEHAADVLAAAGTPVTKLTLNGEIVKIRMEHVWVRAYVPYTDYRGAGESSGDYVWIDLDTGIKEYEDVENIYETLKEEGIEDDLDGFIENGGDVSQLEEILVNWDEKISSMDLDNTYARKRIISQKEESYLPLSLQYEVLEESETFSQVKKEDKDSVGFSVNGEMLASYTASELYGKNVVLSFIPASDADSEIYESYDSIFDIPAYLVYMIPVVYIDGEIAAKGDEYLEQTIGTSSTFTINLSSGGNTTTVSNEVTTGSMYAVTIDSQSITADELQAAYDGASALADSVTEENVYSVEYMGRYLGFAGKLYFAQLDLTDTIAAECYDVSNTRTLSEAITGYEAKKEYAYGQITGIDFGQMYIDVDMDSHCVISLYGDEDSEKEFMFATGIISSTYESGLWEELTGEESVSTITVLEEASNQGIEILTINDSNLEESLETLNTTDSTLTEIRNAVNAGNLVIIPEQDMVMGSWSGTGYIILDMETGAGAYLISGGLNGGCTEAEVTFYTMYGFGLGLYDIAQGMMMFFQAINTIANVGALTLLSTSRLILSSVFVGLSVWSCIQVFKLYDAYMEGDESKGEELITQVIIEAVLTLGSELFIRIAKPIFELIIKNKLISSLGLGAVEKLLNSGMDITEINKYIKYIRELGIPDDLITEFAEKYGKEGIEWLRKVRGLNLSVDYIRELSELTGFSDNMDDIYKIITETSYGADDIAECIMKHGDEALKYMLDYGDEAADAIINYGDDALRAISSYGGDAATAISKYGDDAISAIDNYGGNTATVISNYGDDAMNAINSYGNDAVAAISKHGDDAVFAIKNYGDDAAKVISEYGDDAIDEIVIYGDYAIEALKNGKTAAEIESEFAARVGSDSFFANELQTALEDANVSLKEYTKLRLTNVYKLSKKEIALLKQIRDAVPDIDADTVLQKVIPVDDIEQYISGNYNTIRGYITRYDDVSHISGYDDVYKSLRLDYENSQFLKGGESYGYIKFKTKDTDIIDISYGELFGGANTDGYPCTLNGFTGSTNGEVIPEWLIKKGKYVEPIDGAEIHKVINGEDTIVAIYKKGYFEKVE